MAPLIKNIVTHILYISKANVHGKRKEMVMILTSIKTPSVGNSSAGKPSDIV